MYWWIQKSHYIEEVGSIPEEYPEGSEGYKQFMYDPRRKDSREYFKELTGQSRTRKGGVKKRRPAS